jgi:hypothetical protein
VLRLVARATALVGCVFAVAVCGEQGRFTTATGGGGGGTGNVIIQVPSDTSTKGCAIITGDPVRRLACYDSLSLPVSVGDSVLVQVRLVGTRGVTSFVLTGTSVRGSKDLGTDSTVTRFTPRSATLPKGRDTTITRYLRAVLTDSTSELVTITAISVNAAKDTSKDTSVVRVVSGPKVSVLQPAAGAVTAKNKWVMIQVRGIDPLGVKVLGWRATGVVTSTRDTTYGPVSGVMADTQTFTDSLLIPASTAVPGNFVITPFATDSLDQPSGIAPGVTVAVQNVVGDTIPPLVRDTMPLRVEVGDSLTVTATDPSGITKVGFIVKDLTGTELHRESVTFAGGSTNVTQRFGLNLGTIVTTFPKVVTVEAFAVDGASPPNTGGSTITGTPKKSPLADKDTLTVVAGTTISLPQGGRFGDAVMNPNRNELYLTNTLLNQIEVFQLNTYSFAKAIPVGSQPIGIALWPRDTVGTNADTVIVANSGGTNLSIVDMVARNEVQRHRLANYIVQTVKTQPTAAGGIEILTTDYDLADRPQYLGAVCRHLAGAACDTVYAVYSTAPTPAQPAPFTSRGYLASENLSAPVSARSGHLFYELASPGTDTLQIVAVRDTLPGQQIRDTILGAGIGYLADLATVAFQESTFVRNSGDFNHAVIGEGGLNQGFARALSLDGRKPVQWDTVGTGTCLLKNPNVNGVPAILGTLNCVQVVDSGVSPGILVRDFLVNRAAKVLSVATNFNGRTSLVRADSIYAFDYTLKLSGLLPVPSGQPGMDFDPNNAFDANTRMPPPPLPALNKNDRLVFAARPDPFIDVFDTYWYQRVATIPIRDTIIGPVRVANTGGVLVLVGVTSRGLVVVRLPPIVNQYPVRQQPGAALQPVRVLLSTPQRPGGRP